MSENKIKKGQKTWFDNFSSYWITNDNNAAIAITCGESTEDAEEIADNIISAYNGTWGKGIHPDAVEGLLQALEAVRDFDARMKAKNTPAIGNGIMSKVHAAIKKSKL